MRRLKGANVGPSESNRGTSPSAPGVRTSLPRAFASHATSDGYAYRRYLLALQQRLGPLPAAADTTLREAGRLSVELGAMGFELATARMHKRKRDMARLRRQMVPMRTQLLTLEKRLEELSGRTGFTNVPNLVDVLAGPK